MKTIKMPNLEKKREEKYLLSRFDSRFLLLKWVGAASSD